MDTIYIPIADMIRHNDLPKNVHQKTTWETNSLPLLKAYANIYSPATTSYITDRLCKAIGDKLTKVKLSRFLNGFGA